jgi:hypothetical protein
MFAFLKLVPLKDWLYAAALAVAISGFIWYSHHERDVGRQQIEAADKKLADAQQKLNQALTDLAQAKSTKTGEDYAHTVATPVDHPPVARLCRPASGGGAVPGAPGSGPAADAHAPVGSPDSGNLVAGPDIGSALVTVGRDDDALIVALQEQVRILLDMMQKARGSAP